MANGLLDTFNNLGLSSKLGLLSTGVELLEGRPLGEAVKTGIGTYGGLSSIQQDQKQKEGIALLEKQFANNPKMLALLRSNPQGFMNAYTTSAFTPTTDASTSLMKNIRFLKEQFPDKSIAELIAMTKQPANVVNVNSGGDLNNAPLMKKLMEDSADFLETYGNMSGNIDSLEGALEELETNPNITGLGQGLTNLIGGDSALKLLFPDTANTKATIESVVQESLKAVLGAQFTENEGKRILARAFDPAVTPQENAKRLRVILNKIKVGFETKKRYFEAFSKGEVPDFNLPTKESLGLSEGSSSTINKIPESMKVIFKDLKPDNVSVKDWEMILNNMSAEEIAPYLKKK